MARAMTLALCCALTTALLAPPPKRTAHTKPRAMGLAGPVDPAAALAVSTVSGDVRKAMTFGALFLSSALLHAAEVSITTLYPWKVQEFAEEATSKIVNMRNYADLPPNRVRGIS